MSTNPGLLIVSTHISPDHLNDDTFRMCNQAYRETHIHIPLIRDIFVLYKRENKTPELNKKLMTLQADMSLYLKKREDSTTPLQDLIFAIQEMVNLEFREVALSLQREVSSETSPIKTVVFNSTAEDSEKKSFQDRLYLAINRADYSEIKRLLSLIAIK